MTRTTKGRSTTGKLACAALLGLFLLMAGTAHAGKERDDTLLPLVPIDGQGQQPQPEPTAEDENGQTTISSPTSLPSEMVEDVGAEGSDAGGKYDTDEIALLNLPEMVFMLTLKASDGVEYHDVLIKELMEVFLTDFVSNNAILRKSFERLELETTVIEKASSNANDGNKLLVVKSSGYAVYDDSDSNYELSSRPTQAEVARTIETYFRFWGPQDLQKDLISAGGLPVVDLAVTIDGRTVSETNDGSGSTSIGAAVGNNPSDQSNVNTRGIIVAVAVVGAFVVAAFGIWLYMFCRKRAPACSSAVSQKSLEALENGAVDNTTTDIDNDSPRTGKSTILSLTPRIIRRKRSGSPGDEANKCSPLSDSDIGDGDDQLSYCGVHSVAEDSLFTSTASLFQYDASRLDHVLSSARHGGYNSAAYNVADNDGSEGEAVDENDKEMDIAVLGIADSDTYDEEEPPHPEDEKDARG